MNLQGGAGGIKFEKHYSQYSNIDSFITLCPPKPIWFQSGASQRLSSSASTSAPAAMRHSAAVFWPFVAAKWSGVKPRPQSFRDWSGTWHLENSKTNRCSGHNQNDFPQRPWNLERPVINLQQISTNTVVLS